MLGGLRSSLKPLFLALAQPFIALQISPTRVTLLGIPFALACAYAYATQQWGWALILLPLAGLWDMIDGTVARAQGKQSLWGNYFETMMDKLVEIIVFIGLAFVAPIAAISALGLGLLSSYAKPRVALVIITDNRDWPAIGEHADKMAILWLGTLWAVLNPINGIEIFTYALWIIALVSGIGTIQRMQYAKKLIAAAEKKGEILPYLKKGKER
jgi:phosphatidylglycerophosphate synthase